ncbi:MAG: SusC/RagA family TonB-linked outer membrane protein [Flaviaesturariibacter sp.]|nr:SusC/RagA family TonB-linked outer membrane protein [Flaviaesturariibacter sp.]
MNVLKRLLTSSLFLLFALAAIAQNRPVSGRILSDDGAPLAGVTVRVKGTNRSVQTDASGNYTISVQTGNVLQFSYVGFDFSESAVGSGSTMDLRMKRTDNTLETVTVAMDIKRNPKELGYSVQKVSGSEIQETQRENFVDALQGRIAGLTITPSSGVAGSSTQIVLRGFNSMSLDNGPLFIMDGIVMDNQTMSENHGGGGPGTGLGLASARENRNNDYSSRISDINPNDIETITVLKGPEATALYGSQAAGGAIVITTKKGNNSGRVGITYDNAFRLSKQTRYPKFQTLYDGGANGVAQNVFSYFGPAYGANAQTFDNSFDKFFKTGFSQTHNLGAEYGKKNYTFRFSGSYFNQEGTVPNNIYNRYTARITNTTKIGKYIDIAPSFTYVHTNTRRPLRGVSGYMLNLLQWPADNNILDWQTEDGFKKGLYLSNPNSEIDNPFFHANRNGGADKTNRMTGTMGININPAKWMTLSGRFGYDTYHTEGSVSYHPASFYVTRQSGGLIDNFYRDYKNYNHTITATARHKIGDFSGRLMVGNMWQESQTDMFAINGTQIIDSVSAIGQMWLGGRVITQGEYEKLIGRYPDSNVARSAPATRLKLSRATIAGRDIPNSSFYRNAAFFGEASISWRNAIFLTYSHRFEEASVFPKDFRNYNYPAGSISVMLTDLFPSIKSKVLNYAKLRGSRANTARTSAPYANQPTFNPAIQSGGGFYYGFTNANPFLRPERQKTYEVGTELRFFNSRLNLDATYYNTRNSDLIVELFRTSYGTGFVLNTLNVGANENKGIEIALEAVPVQTNNFKWSTRLNFNRMRNKVLQLPPNVPEFYISDTWLYGNARGGLTMGNPTTTITAYGYQRNNAGDILIDPATGLALVDANFKVRGDRNPDFTLGALNSISYKNLRFSMLWDFKVGGDIFNGTEQFLTRAGRSLRTSERMTPRVIKGVLRDGFENSGAPIPNEIAVIPYYNQGYFTTMPEEEFIEKDINWARLRDVTLNYTFPRTNLRFLKSFKTLSAFITGNDLILLTNYTGADPAVNGNTAGTRGVGAFGFDFGNVGTPISVNFGLKASF